MTLDQINTREDAFDMLEGYSETRQGELADRRARRPLVKSYMLETVPPTQDEPDLTKMFAKVGCRLIRIDETLFRCYDALKQETIGLVERLMTRHPVLYSTEDVKRIGPVVERLVQSNAALDNVWLSGRTFEQLFKIVLANTPKHRFGRLVFRHETLFDSPDAVDHFEDDEDRDVGDGTPPELEGELREGGEEDAYVPERRATRFEMVDRLSVLDQKLPQMRQLYSPLHAISQLRFPARGRGGHDFYYNGKVTNRSNSFADHRQHIEFVLGLYNDAVVCTETKAWQSVEQNKVGSGPDTQVVSGAPVVLKFSEPGLSQSTFDTFIKSTFRRRSNAFRLWGSPIALGPRKVHVYGVDRHIWQPLFLEITDKHIVAVIPRGTCGNSVHRLVTNVQQYLDPGVDVWVGDTPYAELIRTEPSYGGSDGD